MHECSAKGMAALRRVERTETQTANQVSVANSENTCQCVAAGGSAAFCFDECICEAALPLLVRPCKAPSSKGNPMI